jgi:hypothetical protein
MMYSPLVGLPADTYEAHGFLFHSLGDKYVRAVAEVSKCTPVMIPSMIDALHLDQLLDHFDGMKRDVQRPAQPPGLAFGNRPNGGSAITQCKRTIVDFGHLSLLPKWRTIPASNPSSRLSPE